MAEETDGYRPDDAGVLFAVSRSIPYPQLLLAPQSRADRGQLTQFATSGGTTVRPLQCMEAAASAPMLLAILPSAVPAAVAISSSPRAATNRSPSRIASASMLVRAIGGRKKSGWRMKPTPASLHRLFGLADFLSLRTRLLRRQILVGSALNQALLIIPTWRSFVGPR